MSQNYTQKPNTQSYERREDPKVYIPKKPTTPVKNK